MKKLVRRFLFSVACLMSSSAFAAIVFTFETTNHAAALGYTVGQSATFVVTIEGDASSMGPDGRYWSGSIYSTISGTGLSGAFSSSFDNADLSIISPGDMSGQVGNISEGLGLSANGTPLFYLNFLFTLPEDFHAYSPSEGPISPQEYFSQELGSYVSPITDPMGNSFKLFDDGIDYAGFTIDRLTISSVPEPSTYALYVAAIVLGLAIFRRRETT
jgi:hypothetical protein